MRSGCTGERGIGRGGFFALSFGSIVGSGWIVLLGEWLRRAAPGGTLLALLAGCVLMSVVGMCYAELAARLPRAGGEFLYALEGLGRRPAFLVGWFLTLFLTAICAFEGTALAWLIEILLPALRGPFLYKVLGQSVSVGDIILGLGGAAVICALNLAGVAVSVLFHRVVTYGFIGVMAALILAGLVFGETRNLAPMFTPTDDQSWLLGSAWLFSTCAMLLYGFQAALYLIEERASGITVSAVTRSMVLGITGAAVFYGGIVISAGRVAPWRTISSAELPAVTAFDRLRPGGVIGTIILGAAVLSLAKTWNGVMLMASRMLLAQSRAQLLPAVFQHVDLKRHTPTRAIWLVTAASAVGILLGRGALVPVINTATICVATTIALMLVVLLRLRHRENTSPGFAVPGGRFVIATALAVVGLMAAIAVCQPLWRETGIPLEWEIIIVWALMGLTFSFLSGRRT
jgi:basic amino acid/polyamine antiporter, APA family